MVMTPDRAKLTDERATEHVFTIKPTTDPHHETIIYHSNLPSFTRRIRRFLQAEGPCGKSG